MSNGTTTWTNTYNADGLRTKRTNGTTTYSYVYAGSSLLSVTVGNDILYFNYDAAGTPLTVTWNGTTYYYATNLQGDVVAILDSAGTAVVSYTYDAWGNPISTTGTLATTLGQYNPLRYRGYVYDIETSLYYLQTRYYNPRVCRFLNADGYTSTTQGFTGNNTFTYCGNSPVLLVDSSGTLHEISAGAVGPYVPAPNTTNENGVDNAFKTVGAGIQLAATGSYGVAAAGGGVEIIVYWDTPECQASGEMIVAVYAYGDGLVNLDAATINDAVQLLLKNTDLLKLDGATVLDALVASLKLDVSITASGFIVQANNSFYGVNDYTGGFSTESLTIGSIALSRAWSNSCRTYGGGYTYSFGRPALRLGLPVYNSGYSYYLLLYSSN